MLRAVPTAIDDSVSADFTVASESCLAPTRGTCLVYYCNPGPTERALAGTVAITGLLQTGIDHGRVECLFDGDVGCGVVPHQLLEQFPPAGV